MEPKNEGLEDDFPFQVTFRFHVDFPGCILFECEHLLNPDAKSLLPSVCVGDG